MRVKQIVMIEEMEFTNSAFCLPDKRRELSKDDEYMIPNPGQEL